MTSNTLKKLSCTIKDGINNFKKAVLTHKVSILFCFFFSILYVLPILLANVYYRDDLKRSISGFGWKEDGRHISTFIMGKLTGGGFITDYFPYSPIFAAFIISISGYIISSIIGLEKKNKIKFSALILLINPFFLENLSYRWDAIPMSISILAVVVPFLFRSSRWSFTLTSIIGIFITMFTYQASVIIYILMTLIILIKGCLDEDKILFKKIIWAAISFILGIVLYKIVATITHINLEERGSFIFLKENFSVILTSNFKLARDLIKSAFSRYYLVLVIISVMLALIGFIKFIKSNKTILSKVLTIVYIVLILFFIPCTIILLDNAWIGARILVTFPFLYISITHFYQLFFEKIVSYISIFFIFLSFALVSTYGNALKAQYLLETNISQTIAEKVNLGNKNVAFIGNVAYAPEVYGSVEKFPVFKYILPTYLGDNVWDLIYLAKTTDFRHYPSTLNHQDSEYIKKIRNSIPIVDENFYYVLRADSTQIIIDFESSTSTTMKIETP